MFSGITSAKLALNNSLSVDITNHKAKAKKLNSQFVINSDESVVP